MLFLYRHDFRGVLFGRQWFLNLLGNFLSGFFQIFSDDGLRLNWGDSGELASPAVQ